MGAPTETTKSFIERISETLGIIPKISDDARAKADYRLEAPRALDTYPPPERWDDWEENDAAAWPEIKKKNYAIVPTSCFNCEAGCGLLSYIDKESGKVAKFEGNPYHPGSRGKNCAKGPATINQIDDKDRILYPMKRVGERGSGKWERVSWESVLDDISARIRKALQEERRNEVVYHVGRPGHEGYIERVLQAWGVDGYNSHTNICSGGARLGYVLWDGADRPSPDYGNAKFILLISAHLESGHYFNPHAQRILEAKAKGCKIAVMDPRLSNTASRADYWMPTYPGSEPAVLLAIAKIILDEGLYDAEFMRRWVNWDVYLKNDHPGVEVSFENFIEKMKEEYKEYTPEFAEQESGIKPEMLVEVARLIADSGSQFSTHTWRSATIANRGGWQVARCLQFLNVLTGSVGTIGGVSPNSWNKFHPHVCKAPPPQNSWNEMHFPDEYPLTHYELSQLLPHFLKEGRGTMDVYFTRVFNPVWTYPDGFSWIEALSDESKVGMHIALTPTWNETAFYADYVLPMGHASERHDLLSYETHSGVWIAFRQPVLREWARRQGKKVEFSYETNPGEVWEEDEFWIELSWRIDPDGSMGIKDYFTSPYREGEKLTIEEYYKYLFENVKGLPEKAAEEGLDALEYMRKYGAFEVSRNVYEKHETTLTPAELEGSRVAEDEGGLIYKNGKAVGVMIEGEAKAGFTSPSKKLEFYSQTMVDWNWSEYRLPTYIKSHVHPDEIDYKNNEFPLVPTYRLPTLIHSRSGNAKWLMEISNRNPLWISPEDGKRLGYQTGDLVRVCTEIGYFVARIWVTEGIRPGTLCCSHHLGRWRRDVDPKANRWAVNTVKISQEGEGKWRMRNLESILAEKTEDPDTERIFWHDGGVHQNITFPVHPDPHSGMHCWHQKVRLEKARPDDRYADVFVDTNKSFAVYKEWLALTRPGPNADGLRRPLWLKRPLRPTEESFYKSPPAQSS